MPGTIAHALGEPGRARRPGADRSAEHESSSIGPELERSATCAQSIAERSLSNSRYADSMRRGRLYRVQARGEHDRSALRAYDERRASSSTSGPSRLTVDDPHPLGRGRHRRSPRTNRVPALANAMSSEPNRSTVPAISASTSDLDAARRSAARPTRSAELRLGPGATRVASRSPIITCVADRPRTRRAVASPMPDVPPVTTATLPVSFPSEFVIGLPGVERLARRAKYRATREQVGQERGRPVHEVGRDVVAGLVVDRRPVLRDVLDRRRGLGWT